MDPSLLAKYAFLAFLYAFIALVFVLMLRQSFGPARVDRPRIAQLASRPHQRGDDTAAFLRLEVPGQPSREIPLRQGASLTIGRSPDSSLPLEDKFASANHARIFFADGAFCLRDEDSTNGTMVNGERITNPVALQEGDRVTIGLTTLVFAAGSR